MRGPGVLGKYRLLAELGRGGMADVFLAVSQDSLIEFTKLLVIKSLRNHEGDDGELLSMFLDEARLAARLRHPNVVQAFEIGQDGPDCYLVLEYLDGQPLHRVLSRAWRLRPLPLPLHFRVLADVLAGLHYAHELCDFDGTPLGIVHRDVSPHNVFVTYDGQVKVVDFGIAKAATATVETRTGVVKGKVTYMAPEQARGEPVDRRADLFSVGVMLWEALAGRRFWEGVPEHQVLVQLTNDRLPVSLDAALGPEPLWQICTRALALDPERRYPSAEAMRQDLEDYLAMNEVRSSPVALGRFVAELFEDRRSELRGLVEEQLRGQPGLVATVPDRLMRSTASLPAAGGGTASELRGGVPSRPHPAGASASGSYDRIETPASLLPPLRSYDPLAPSDVTTPSPSWPSEGRVTSATAAAITRPGVPEPVRGRSRVALAAAAVGAVAVGVMGVRAVGMIKGPGAPSHPASPPSVAAVVPEIAEVRLSATPPTASIYYDDVPLKNNPYAGKFARDGTAHRVRVEAPGFRTQQQMVTLDKPVIEVALVLVPEKVEPPVREGATTPTVRPRGPARPPPPPPDDVRPYRKTPMPALPSEDPWEDGKQR